MARWHLDGKSFDYKEDYFIAVEQVFKNLYPKGLTSGELATRLNYKSPDAVKRNIMTPLINQGLLEKVEDTHRYRHRPQISDEDKVIPKNRKWAAKKIESCESMIRWKKHCSTKKSSISSYNQFLFLCSGKNEKLPKFQMYPDTWRHPQTTETVVEQLREAYGVTRLGSHIRGYIRRFIKYGLQITLTKEEAEHYGIDGSKDNMGASATASLEEGQYEKALEFCKDTGKIKLGTKKENFDAFLMFGVAFHTFVRPSVLFTLKLDQIFFYDRKIQYVISKSGKKKVIAEIIDNKIEILDEYIFDLAQDKKIESFTETKRTCFLKDVLEFKTTGKSSATSKWPKWIRDENVVIPLEEYVKGRLHQGKKYLFWHDNSRTFHDLSSTDYKKYDSIVKWARYDFGKFLQKLFRAIGCVDEVFFKRATYAMRHIGVQYWCEITDYKLEFIAEMGWNDIETLRTFYARRTHKSLEKTLAKVIG